MPLRNSFIYIFVLISSILAGCDRNTGPLPETEHPDAAYILRLSSSPATGVTFAAGAVLFYGARPAGGGPPVYVARREKPRFPSFYYLTSENRLPMSANADPTQPLILFARIDADGNASSVGPSDWVAESTRPVMSGNTQIELTLTQLAPEPSFSLPVEITGNGVPLDATVFVLLRQKDGRMPLAAIKATPRSYPAMVTFTNQHLLGGALPDSADLEVIVKVDQDGNPQTTVPGDYYGSAPAEPPVSVALQPDSRAAP